MGVREREAAYELVAASQTAQVLGPAGGPGDILKRVIVTASTGTTTILDGAVTILVIPAAVAVGSVFEIGAACVTNWNITTAAATSVMCVGDFT